MVHFSLTVPVGAFVATVVVPSSGYPLVLFQLQELPRTSVPWSVLPSGCTFSCCGTSAALLTLVMMKGFPSREYMALLLAVATNSHPLAS
jgi:hypothetical protein